MHYNLETNRANGFVLDVGSLQLDRGRCGKMVSITMRRRLFVLIAIVLIIGGGFIVFLSDARLDPGTTGARSQRIVEPKEGRAKGASILSRQEQKSPAIVSFESKTGDATLALPNIGERLPKNLLRGKSQSQ